MTFLHKEITGDVLKLTYVNNKGTYQSSGIQVKGHLKAIGVDDKTFQITETLESSFKLTINMSKTEQDLNITGSDKIQIGSDLYIVKAIKRFFGITFDTTKILLTK